MRVNVQTIEDFTIIPISVFENGDFQYEVENGIRMDTPIYMTEPEEYDEDMSDNLRESCE